MNIFERSSLLAEEKMLVQAMDELESELRNQGNNSFEKIKNWDVFEKNKKVRIVEAANRFKAEGYRNFHFSIGEIDINLDNLGVRVYPMVLSDTISHVEFQDQVLWEAGTEYFELCDVAFAFNEVELSEYVKDLLCVYILRWLQKHISEFVMGWLPAGCNFCIGECYDEHVVWFRKAGRG